MKKKREQCGKLLQIQKAKRRIEELELEILEAREAMTSLSHSGDSNSGAKPSNPETRSPQEKLMKMTTEMKIEAQKTWMQ